MDAPDDEHQIKGKKAQQPSRRWCPLSLGLKLTNDGGRKKARYDSAAADTASSAAGAALGSFFFFCKLA
jgi:hypothetical protein